MKDRNKLKEYLQVLRKAGIKFYTEKEGKLTTVTIATNHGIHVYNYKDNNCIGDMQMEDYSYEDSLADAIKNYNICNCTNLKIFSGDLLVY